MARPRVLLLALGGTISMKGAPGQGIVPTLTGADLVAAVPGLGAVAEIEARSPYQLPGASLTLSHLNALAGMIDAALADDFAGVVVVQGTDTIEETAFVLDCLVGGVKPVVVTGAMRGPEAAGADGPANILAAVTYAASPDMDGRGVVAILNDEIHAARYVRKGHTGLASAFTSSPQGPIGLVLEGRARMHARTIPMPKLPRLPDGDDLPAVALVTLGLGDDGRMIDAVPGLGYAGAVIVGMGAGHAPGSHAAKLAALAERMPVILATRVVDGPVFTKTYGFPGSETDLLAKGLIPSGSLGPAKSRIFLQMQLASGASTQSIKASFSTVN
ncbi:asparaginase [Pikeienuella sp. HZG-20]|uniref:asparaginase n=1 Tax=Paludibacillus litoralis TaxID=3133267 RepID=UPI0030EE450F